MCVSRRPKKDDDRADGDKKKDDDTGTDDKTKDDDSKADDGDDNKSDGSSSSSSSMVPAASSSAGAAITQESPNRSRVRPDPYVGILRSRCSGGRVRAGPGPRVHSVWLRVSCA